jgi:Uma2 family endonuclease
MSVQLDRRLFTVAEYHRMIAAGVFAEDDRLELLQGEIVHMSPIGSRHAACVKRLNHLLTRIFSGRAIVGVQDPVQLSIDSEPQPDLVLLRPRADFYSAAHPQPRDVWLVIEVADTSAEPDRTLKIPLYARAGIPEVWLVDLAEQQIEVYREPSGQSYQEKRVVKRGQSLTVHAFPELALTADEILG